MTARHLSLTLSVLLVSTSFAETDLTPETRHRTGARKERRNGSRICARGCR